MPWLLGNPSISDDWLVKSEVSPRSRLLAAEEKISKDGGSSAELSLWDQAYNELDSELRGRYEKLLSEPTATNGESLSEAPRQTVKRSQSPNHISQDPKTRQVQLDEQIKRGLDLMDQKSVQLNIGGWKFVLQDQVANAAEFVEGVKDFVGEAVKVSPEASLVWAGVCLVVPLLTKPAAVQKANEIGFAYVTSRMRFYIELEQLLLPENQVPSAGVTNRLKEEFAKSIVDLYTHILEFQLKSVLRFNRSQLGNLAKAFVGEDWEGMLKDIKDLEQRVYEDSKRINTSESRRQLVRLGEIASQQRDITHQLLEFQKDEKYKLPMTLRAVYISASERGEADRCHADTRREIRRRIMDWANDRDGESILWVSGPAGTGKSTIARTMTYSFGVHGRLAATYFFKRGEQERNDSSRLFPTIASQLMARVPQFKTHVRNSMESRSLDGKSVEIMPLGSQVEALLSAPLGKMDPGESDVTRVIVVDALDECTQQKDVHQILHLLSSLKTSETVPLRVLLTSRPTRAIERSFNSLQREKTAFRRLDVIDKEFEKENTSDVTLFLQDSFERIKENNELIDKSWPAAEEMAHVISLATIPRPLFIYAQTVCLFIDNGTGNPVTRLSELLEKSGSAGTQSHEQLDTMYNTVLEEVWFGADGETSSALVVKEGQVLMDMLRSVVLLATPLPKTSLTDLLGIGRHQLLLLENLKPVLKIPSDDSTPVELIHKSFSDFLLVEEGAGMDNHKFRVLREETHAMLALKCLERMMAHENGLRKDMYGSFEYGKSKNELDKMKIRKRFPPDLEYACLNWVYHLDSCQQRAIGADCGTAWPPDMPVLLEKIEAFLYEHFFHWLESLSLLGGLSVGVPSIRKLLNIVKVGFITHV